jgi:hypothetical protein
MSESVQILRHPAEELVSHTVQAHRRAKYTKRGSTPNFTVSYQTALGQSGATLAQAVLGACEADYSQMQRWFGNLVPPGLPFTCFIDKGSFGAYHMTCADTALHLAAFDGKSGELVEMVNMAEVVEVFSAAQAKGWDCGAGNGEGLSRVLATELHPTQLNGFTTASAWLDSNPRPNFVDNNDPTDRNAVSTGCSVLFLNYLHYQLGFSWHDIVAAGGVTLADTHATLTGKSGGWSAFSALLEAHFPTGRTSGVTKDNVFPL